MIFEPNPIRKLIYLGIGIPIFLLIRWLTGLMTTPDWVSSFTVLEIILAAIVSGVVYLIGERMIRGADSAGSWDPPMLALIVVCAIGFTAFSVWEGLYMHRADYPAPDPQAEQMRDQIRAAERMMKESQTRASETNQPNPMDPDAVERLNNERLQKLLRDAASRDREQQLNQASTRPASK